MISMGKRLTIIPWERKEQVSEGCSGPGGSSAPAVAPEHGAGRPRQALGCFLVPYSGLTWMRNSACNKRLNNMSAMILLMLGKG